MKWFIYFACCSSSRATLLRAGLLPLNDDIRSLRGENQASRWRLATRPRLKYRLPEESHSLTVGWVMATSTAAQAFLQIRLRRPFLLKRGSIYTESRSPHRHLLMRRGTSLHKKTQSYFNHSCEKVVDKLHTLLVQVVNSFVDGRVDFEKFFSDSGKTWRTGLSREACHGVLLLRIEVQLMKIRMAAVATPSWRLHTRQQDYSEWGRRCHSLPIILNLNVLNPSAFNMCAYKKKELSCITK